MHPKSTKLNRLGIPWAVLLYKGDSGQNCDSGTGCGRGLAAYVGEGERSYRTRWGWWLEGRRSRGFRLRVGKEGCQQASRSRHYHQQLTGDLMQSESVKAVFIRTGSTKRLHWVKATGIPATRSRKAAQYLRDFDYKQAAIYDLDTVILAKVVCNLRNYYRQSVDETVGLVLNLFNPKSWEIWSEEAVRLTWTFVEGFTPSLGLADEKAIAKRRADLIENEAVDLIAWTIPGGRASINDLRATFNRWNPGINAEPTEFGRAVAAVTGLSTKVSHGTRYWVGFHLPTPEELMERSSEAA